MSPFDLIAGPCTDIRRESLLTDDAAVLAAARSRDPRCEHVTHEIRDGQFFIFDRHTWHGSRNTAGTVRVAATLFFARADARVRIPTAFGSMPVWYREQPPCILVAGQDRSGHNKLVPPPVACATTDEEIDHG
jgi:ectoine hydroxylase-related dioxygenase (phytanoyl-CoA dioxygenase family)